MRDDTKRGCHTPEPTCAERVQANEEAPEDGISFKAKYRANLYDTFFLFHSFAYLFIALPSGLVWRFIF